MTSFLLYFLLSSSTHAIELVPPPETNYFSMSVWKERRVIIIPKEGLQMTSPALLSVDEIILRGPLVTNGFPLQIDTLRLTFEVDGKIIAFDKPANIGSTGPKGAGAILNDTVAGKGFLGEDGHTGGQGQDGHDDPGAIVVHAVETIGTPIIDGQGQQGGQGGQGGKGGRGGEGGQGTHGDVSCGGRDRQAGRGGQGGMGGKGGQGGNGGRAGRPVPVIFICGNAKSIQAKSIQTSPGLVGEKGNPGDPGDKGPGGKGGNGDSEKCGAFNSDPENVNPGPPGFDGPEQKETLGFGHQGPLGNPINRQSPMLKLFLDLQPNQPRPIIYSFDRLADKRVEMIRPWLHFHWARTFLILVYETMAELQSTETAVNYELTSADLFAQLLEQSSQERAQLLLELWEERFIEPLKKESGSDVSGFSSESLVAAQEVVKVLGMVAQKQPHTERLQLYLQSLISKTEEQFQGSLETALFLCLEYTQLLQSTDRRAVQLSPYYQVPVCDGQPDFRKKQNISLSIKLFQKWKQNSSDDFKDALKTVALMSPIEKNFQARPFWILDWLLPVAHAEEDLFDVIEVQPPLQSAEALTNSIPNKSWLAVGYGRLDGFSAPPKNLTLNKIGSELENLSRTLNVLKRGQK